MISQAARVLAARTMLGAPAALSSRSVFAQSAGALRAFSSGPAPPSPPPSSPSAAPAKKQDMWSGLIERWGIEATRVKSVGNRWKIIIPAIANHLCIGSPYAWSMLADPMTRELGIVVSAAGDWGLATTAGVMSITFAFQGITSALVGNWQNRVGPIISCAVAALFFGSGILVSAAGVMTHSLPLVYLGYGVLSGIGVGMAYTPPIQVLMEYFPDKKGLASGMVIAGFGSASLILTPIAASLMGYFKRAPEYLGVKDSLDVFYDAGRMLANLPGRGSIEVVYASAREAATAGLAEGYYAVGSGSTGVAETLFLIGGVYLATMFTAAFQFRKPPVGYLPEGYTPPTTTVAAAGNVHVNTVMTVPQFWALGGMFMFMASGGLALLSVAKPLMLQTFSASIPEIVTPAFAGGFVMSLSAGNLVGRLFWPSLCDKFGYRITTQVMTLSTAALFASLPALITLVGSTHSPLYLFAFSGASVILISIFGGVYAMLPAYEAFMFGPKYVGANHGRMLLASTAASFLGPGILFYLRDKSVKASILEIAARVSPAEFEKKFHMPLTELETGITSGQVTLARISELAPELANPSLYVYNTTLYTMSCLALVAYMAHQSVKPIDPKYFEENTKKNIETAAAQAAALQPKDDKKQA